MKNEKYLSELTTELHCRGVDECRIQEIVAEVETHLQESDEQPLDAFGTAAQYAEEMAAFSETNSDTVSELCPQECRWPKSCY